MDIHTAVIVVLHVERRTDRHKDGAFLEVLLCEAARKSNSKTETKAEASSIMSKGI
jgi:type IV secretory pathway VirB3-like protein